MAAGGTLILESGAVIKDHARAMDGGTGGAGGVDVYGELIMKDGAEISGNRVSSIGNKGGGVFVAPNGKFEMEGGTIKGNKSDNDVGGGVFVGTAGTFIKNGGGVIYGKEGFATDNEAKGKEVYNDGTTYYGHAVYDDKNGDTEDNTLLDENDCLYDLWS